MDLLIMGSVPALMLFISIVLFSDKKKLKLVEGGIYSIKNSKGQFGIMKILQIDEHVLHSLVFRQLFDERPKHVDLSTISSNPRYVKINIDTINKWYAQFLGSIEVEASEISSYVNTNH